jgi:hypothetical protein
MLKGKKIGFFKRLRLMRIYAKNIRIAEQNRLANYSFVDKTKFGN